MRWGRILFWAATAVLAREAFIALGPRRWNRQETFARARARARELGLPLIVVGAPRTGGVNPIFVDYGCGELCLDLVGCEGCEATMAGRLEDTLPLLPARRAVVFVSCTLEYVDDVELVWRELRRVAGDELFVVTVEPWTLTAFFWPGAQRRVLGDVNPNGPLRYRPLPWVRTTRVLPRAT